MTIHMADGLSVTVRESTDELVLSGWGHYTNYTGTLVIINMAQVTHVTP